ncbi:hypothetical protein AKJ41_06415, partial [candidate division MSBL1 archaeon SCGC-AAA259O05]
MKRKRAKKILEESYREYRENPRGWSFWVSPEADPPEVYLIHGDTAYFLKVDSLFTPNPIGVGAKFDVEESQLPENLPEYGFRQISRKELRGLFEDLPSLSEIESRREFEETAKEVGRRTEKKLKEKEPTVPSQEKRETATFLGPHHRG